MINIYCTILFFGLLWALHLVRQASKGSKSWNGQKSKKWNERQKNSSSKEILPLPPSWFARCPISKSEAKHEGWFGWFVISLSGWNWMIFHSLIYSWQQTLREVRGEKKKEQQPSQKSKNMRLTIIVSLFPILGKQLWPDIWFSFDSQVITLDFLWSIELLHPNAL